MIMGGLGVVETPEAIISLFHWLFHWHTWLCANRLSLNVEKSNYVIFDTPQKNIQSKNWG